jgi:hypothetical protein
VNLRAIRVLGLGFELLLLCALPLAAAPNSGKISGIVMDPKGTPQMGATVSISAENLMSSLSTELLTNDRGRFSTSTLAPGMYSIKVTLAGFLPAIQQHIQVSDQQTTLLEIVLGSVLSSFEKLRKQPTEQLSSDEWIWVLRSSSATRSILRWQDGNVIVEGIPTQGEVAQTQAIHGRFDLTSGSEHPGSVSNLADSPATAFAYDVPVGERGRLYVAGQFSYEGGSPAGGLVAEWVPSGKIGDGPVTSLVVRESELGANGPIFRGARMSYDNQMASRESALWERLRGSSSSRFHHGVAPSWRDCFSAFFLMAIGRTCGHEHLAADVGWPSSRPAVCYEFSRRVPDVAASRWPDGVRK